MGQWRLNSMHSYPRLLIYAWQRSNRKYLFIYIVEKEYLPRRFLAIEIYCCGVVHMENTSIIVDVFILGDCIATNRNIRYNNGLATTMQYWGKVFTKMSTSNIMIRHSFFILRFLSC
jgi:hypothetical protein